MKRDFKLEKEQEEKLEENLKKVLLEDIKPWKIISNKNDHIIIEGNFQNNITTNKCKFVIDFSFVIKEINFLFTEKEFEYEVIVVFGCLWNSLDYAFGSPEVNLKKLIMFIENMINKIVEEYLFKIIEPTIKELNNKNSDDCHVEEKIMKL